MFHMARPELSSALKTKELDLHFEGEVNGDRITGQATDGKSKLMTTFQATRLADLP
jgi:hypothetical protein